jgi:hypothetical protein
MCKTVEVAGCPVSDSMRYVATIQIMVCPYRSFDFIAALENFPPQDADKVHVQMCEATLEIVGLR